MIYYLKMIMKLTTQIIVKKRKNYHSEPFYYDYSMMESGK